MMELERTREEREARLRPGGFHVFELTASAFGLREERDYEQNGRNGLTLVKNRDLRVLLEVLRQGERLSEHQAPGPITVHVLEGEVKFETGGEVVYLRRGEILSLPSRQRHAVEAVHDAAFLLTIAPECPRAPEQGAR
jgi:quercetin dioxygenase-like cupin family protein